MISFLSILDVVNDFRVGKIQREEYWTKMQSFHLALQGYTGLFRGGNLDRIEIEAEGLNIVLKNGLKMIWNPKDIRAAPNMLINHGEYEPQELAVIEALAKFCRVMFDIGANVGWYALHLAKLLRKTGGRVYAIEPIPQTFTELTRNIQLNGYSDTVYPFNLALGDSDGIGKLYIPSSSGSAAASQRQLFPDDTYQAVECQMVTLDAFVGKHHIDQLDLIKCDVEGSELFVLRGGLSTIETHKPVIMLEMLRKWARAFAYHPNDIISLLKRYGYRCWSYEGRRLAEVSEIDEDCTQTNFFFLHHPKHDNLLASGFRNA